MIDGRFRAEDEHYTRVAIAIHWTVAVLIIVNLAIGLLHESLLKGMIALHKSIGILVLALGVARWVWWLTHRPPPLPTTVKPLGKGLAHLVHWLFYFLIIALPLSGWAFTSAKVQPRPLSFFGLFPLPLLPITRDKALSDTIRERHEQLAWVMVALICIHVAAALKHRFLDRDRTVERMLPGAGPA